VNAILEAILALLKTMEDRDEAYSSVNSLIRKLEPDFPVQLQNIDTQISRNLFGLINAILDDDIAEYYMFEARHMKGAGKITEKDGREWPIRNIDDVRAYILGSSNG
jgi:hypothetical protein